jgi:hypothetical protein
MTKKNWLSLLIVLALATVYAICFTNWFKPQTVQIFHTVREMHFRRKKADDEPVLLFGLSKQLGLTEIKVVPLAAYEKDPHVLPVWHLVSDSNSVPVRDFPYGRTLRGMKPAVTGARAEELDTNLVYRLFITAGKITGHNDFYLGANPPETNAPAKP